MWTTIAPLDIIICVFAPPTAGRRTAALPVAERLRPAAVLLAVAAAAAHTTSSASVALLRRENVVVDIGQ